MMFKAGDLVSATETALIEQAACDGGFVYIAIGHIKPGELALVINAREHVSTGQIGFYRSYVLVMTHRHVGWVMHDRLAYA